MKMKLISFVTAAAAAAAMAVPVSAANENWRDPFVTRIMKIISQDSSYTDVVLTDLDRNGIPEAFVIKKGTFGNIGSGFTMVNNTVTDIETPSNIIGECLENINVYIKNDTYIFAGAEIPRYSSIIAYYKLTLENNKLVATRINKKDVSPYANVNYVDKFSNNVLKNGYPDRTKIKEFIDSYDMVNSISAKLSNASVSVNGVETIIDGYNVNDTNYFKVRDIAMILKDTKYKFNVEWDTKNDGINLVVGYDYIPNGSELMRENVTDIEVLENSTPIFVNGRQKAMTAYNINGSAYFRIRDIADSIGFDITWDESTQTINIQE